MNIMPLNKLGPCEIAPGQVQFGILLPWVSAADGNSLTIKIIHEDDQFIQGIQPISFSLTHSVDTTYGDYWFTQINITSQDRPHNTKSLWGNPGTYIYRYQLQNPNVGTIDWIIDPFAREFGVGKLSAFTLGYQPYQWSKKESNWKTPPMNQLIIYELMLNEFGGSIDGAIAHLSYLADLGINCVEVMPVSNVGIEVDWGFLPIGYFGVDERFGNRKDFQRFIDEAHKLGIAVILDAVYGHTSENFLYQYLYNKLNYNKNPFMGPFAKDYFGCSTDFKNKITQDFFYTVNQHWLDIYHIDGFRYDCVPNYWDGALGDGYAKLTFFTDELVNANSGNGYWQRFFQGDVMNLVQCAEQLEDSVGVLWQSYSNCTWQNKTFDAANATARGNDGGLTELGLRLGLDGFPTQVPINGKIMPRTALQYLENHDHSRFLSNFGIIRQDGKDGDPLFNVGDRSQWYKIQPYLIALLSAKGIPMLWQGGEFGSNEMLPENGQGRVMMFRPVRWDYFYDEIGQNLERLVRKLVSIRRKNPHFWSDNYCFYNNWDAYQSKGLLMFSRNDGQRFSLVALNFSNNNQTASFCFPKSGNYNEELDGKNYLSNVVAQAPTMLQIPSNYGRIWTSV
jgi:1,4-alpha-glucan branching enzyme